MYGMPELLTASVTPAFATGTVSFFEGETYLGSASLDSTGTATLPVSTLNAGTHNLTATYNGDQGVPASISNAAQVTVTPLTGPGGATALTIAVNDATRTASAPNPPFSYTVSGTLVNGDTYATAISGTPTFSTTAGSTPGSYPISMTGLTSANYTLTIVNGTLTVTPDGIGGATTTSLSANTTSSNYGDSITLTATVAPGSVTGAVSFFDGSALLGQGALSGGVATLTTAALGAGSHTITALYSGDSTHSSSVSPAIAVTVAKQPLTVTVQDSSVPIAQAAPQFAYVVTGTLYNGDTYATAVTGTPLYSGFTSGGIVGQTYSISVSGLTGQNYALSFVPGTATIVSSSSTTDLATSATLINYGDSLALTATVTPSSASGTVVFSEGTAVLAIGTLSGGVATLTTSSLAAGRHSITATYPGDSNYGSSTSSVVTVTVLQKPLTVTVNDASRLTGQGNPAFTYTVTGSLVNGDTAATAVTGVPVYSTTAVVYSPAGTYPISIVGGLNSINYSLTFVNGTLTVGQSTTAITLTSSLDPSTYGAPVTLTATLAIDATGTVAFIDQATEDTLGTTAITGGSATLPISTLAVGSHQIVAYYAGDSKYDAATSNALTQRVNQALLTVAADDATRSYNAPNPTFTATITGFVNGDTAAAITGAPSLTTTATITSPVGTYPIVAALGTLAATDYTFTFVNGTLTITAGGETTTTTTLSANPAATEFGTSVTFTANVTPAGATGAVKFSNGVIVLGTGTLSGGIATFTTSLLNAAHTRLPRSIPEMQLTAQAPVLPSP